MKSKAKTTRNAFAVAAMQKRASKFKDRRMKRQNRNSWKKEEMLQLQRNARRSGQFSVESLV
jgi:hypothetical protein